MFANLKPRELLPGLLALGLTLFLVSGAAADDTDLLRFNTGQPYVFVLLDTSTSMNLAPNNAWVAGNGDDPRSKLFQARWALFQVFEDVTDVNLGFASFNQDRLRVRSKHWLYFNTENLPSGWPIAYPLPETDGDVISVGSDGQVEVELDDGDLMTFGKHFPAYEKVVGFETIGEGGTCAAPLDLSKDREKINRFAKLGTYGNQQTLIWINDRSKTYLLTVSKSALLPDGVTINDLGKSTIRVDFTVQRITQCSPLTVSSTNSTNLKLKLMTDFVMWDEDSGASGGNKLDEENSAGWWDWQDSVADASCSDQAPFSGKGWEGNYDSGVTTGNAGYDSNVTDVDEYCTAFSCRNLKFDTTISSYGRPLDRGDVLPLDWATTNHDDFLRRLAPNYPSATPDFRSAAYFEDTPVFASSNLRLRNSSQKPLVANGESPLAKSINDFRCWYLSSGTPGGKCNNNTYPVGWEDLAAANDSEWGCRRPFLIIISDGEDSCTGGESPTADVSNLNSKAGIKTWVVNFGGGNSGQLNSIAQSGKGELINVATRDELRDALADILGEIREEVRSFASAAVPSVQATSSDKIYLTNFTPLNGKAIWDGHVHSFLKPLPLEDGRPVIDHPNHLWDAGAEMLGQTSGLGDGKNERRVYYAQERVGDRVPMGRRYLEQTATEPQADKYDLWCGLGVTCNPGVDLSETAAFDRTKAILDFTLGVKTHTLEDGPIEYLLGDIFHSNPTVIGGPANSFYFATNLHGYRTFAEKHTNRRKMLLVGANDGMVHGFDAGILREDSQGKRAFDNGTGREIFAYIPRKVMPTVASLEGATQHRWSVDGTVMVSDIYIDPLHNGIPLEDDREWRTVLVAGLREGGHSYFALDVTQPDKFENGLPTPVKEISGPSADPNAPGPPDDYVPSCGGDGSGTINTTDCGTIAFPSMLWEFSDDVEDVTGDRVLLDEDSNGEADLAETWSVPTIGRIRVCTGSECDPLASPNDVEDRFVMVFGGGLDAAKQNRSGNYLYMVDMETGTTLYKRRLAGSMAADAAAVDTDQDGYLDRVYAATTTGKVYRVDLGLTSVGEVVSLADLSVRDLNGVSHTVSRIDTAQWVPKLIFDTAGKPIYFRPSVIFVARLGLYGLAFGTGEREDLWQRTNLSGRFYVFVDDTDELQPSDPLPYTEANFEAVDSNTVTTASEDYLFRDDVGTRGWYLTLNVDERVITNTFALAGVTFFSTFEPQVNVSGTKDPLCSKTGSSRLFAVDTTNGNALLRDAEANPTRFTYVSTFVTEPFSELGQTKNDVGDASGSADVLNPSLQQVMEDLKRLYPSNCRFANFRIDIKTISADTGVVFIAPVPVCIVERNWREY